METTNYLITEYILGFYWGYIGIMESKMETTIKGLGYRRISVEAVGEDLLASSPLLHV